MRDFHLTGTTRRMSKRLARRKKIQQRMEMEASADGRTVLDTTEEAPRNCNARSEIEEEEEEMDGLLRDVGSANSDVETQDDECTGEAEGGGVSMARSTQMQAAADSRRVRQGKELIDFQRSVARFKRAQVKAATVFILAPENAVLLSRGMNDVKLGANETISLRTITRKAQTSHSLEGLCRAVVRLSNWPPLKKHVLAARLLHYAFERQNSECC